MDNKIYNIERKQLPLIALRGISIFPNMVLHFDVGRKKSISALETAMAKDLPILLCTQKDPKVDDPKVEDFYQIGTVAMVKQMIKLPGESFRVLVEGISRAKVIEIKSEEPHYEAILDDYIYQEEDVVIGKEIEAAMRLVRKDFREYIANNEKVSPEILLTLDDITDPGRLVDIIASYIFLKQETNQSLLETFDFYERLELLHVILREEIEILEIENKINQRVKKQINKVQKEYYIREQIKAMEKELGHSENSTNELEEYREKIKLSDMPDEVKEKSSKELDRLSKMNPQSAETAVIRDYLDQLLELPWNKETEDILDLKKSREILDMDHYGLKDIKERILEFIAIRKMTDSLKGPIICLVGPPGVGKTSIARSIAKSMNREFVRMSLGGVRDEAEIRGHRRTYIGAMPGRIMYSIKKAASKNPVFLLDEIDKIGSDYRGDPASGLLEVLDPEQNKSFLDHYLDVPFDLSKVLFVTTANTVSTIPRPLLDRMEIIEVSGYTEEEKVQIAIRYLLPKQLKEHGLKEENLEISEEAVRSIVRNYTREAGVRGLERNIAKICRKATKRIVEEDIKTVRINKLTIENYLGGKKYSFDKILEDNQVGLANGLAWTAVGGETLSIEVNTMKGKGKVQLTGKLGDVMKESAMAGISYIRANLNKFNIEEDFYENTDIHIHVPEGAIPKDGPSAGITIATALISALSNTPIYRDLAMTGEITLRGRVLPVGGIKEKVLAANRMGIKKILLPIDNKKDLEDIPDKIKRNIDFVLVNNMDEVVNNALLEGAVRNEDK